MFCLGLCVVFGGVSDLRKVNPMTIEVQVSPDLGRNEFGVGYGEPRSWRRRHIRASDIIYQASWRHEVLDEKKFHVIGSAEPPRRRVVSNAR